LGVAEHLPDVLEAAAEKISVRRHANGLLKCASEMMWGEAGHGGQSVEADLLADVRFDEFANAIFQGGRKAASFRSGASGIGMKLSMLNRGCA